MSDSVKTRFAPSPTGHLHVGGARTALYNFLFARAEGGTFLLRIEDTDRARSEDRFTDAILENLQWLGIRWDEGPYHQSERMERYREAAERLLEEGKAYQDEDPERGTAVRLRMPDGQIVLDDLIHGRVEFDASLAPDFVILKSDGFPTYNFACVVDDAEMGITHVIRGDDHLSNTPSQLAAYEALRLEPPAFAHIPMILGPDGQRLSKRHGATSVEEYRKRGYVPEALVNFIALLGWSPGDDREIMTLEEMCESFRISRVNRDPSRFDTEKLRWMGGQYIREMPVERLVEDIKTYFADRGEDLSERSAAWLEKFAEAYRIRMKTLEELYEASRYLFEDSLEYDPKAVKKVLGKDGAIDRLRRAREMLAAREEWRSGELEEDFRGFCEREGVGLGKVAQPVRVAVTGSTASPPIFDTLELVGRERALARIDEALSKFGKTAADG